MSEMPPQQSQAAAPEAKKKSHVLGKIALVTAIIGFIFACVPGALIIGWVLLPIAFILSLVALFMPGKKGAAVAGLILAVVGTVVGVVVFLAVVVDAADDALDEADKALNEADKHYAVTIDGSHVTKDFEGNETLVVDYTFTNKSEEADSFGMATDARAFQKGVELEDAILDEESAEAKAWMKKVKPGKSVKVQEAYVLDGKAPVELEVTATWDFDETTIAKKKIAID